ncbi:MAG: DNA-deoxyinosine glycosylase [Pseudomonadota bacterium]|nr:DNA-deoxyinosine glycosylase [Pseudomonadota bacterium]
MRKSAFAPIVDATTRVLILGSLPGDLSLAASQYYANPRNRFWHLIGAVIERPDLPELDYSERLAALLKSGIGLWDAVATAERQGSLDSAIRNAQPSALAGMVQTLPQLCAVAFNGKASARIARPLLANAGCALIDLASSSPAHAAMPYEQKRQAWLALRQFIAPSTA